MGSIAGAAKSAGSLLILSAGVRIVSNALPKKRILPKTTFKKPKPFKIKPIKLKKWRY